LDAAPTVASTPDVEANPGNFDNPQAVQMSYFGDTTSVSFPQTRPIFKNGLPSPNENPVPRVSDFLKRPQYIGRGLSGNTDEYFANPMQPNMDLGWVSAANYFRYFGMINRFWRGTLLLHFIVAGHPLIELEFKSVTHYGFFPGATPVDEFSTASVHSSVFSGSKHIVVPLPFLSNRDYFPVVDSNDVNLRGYAFPSWCTILLRVVGTMLDVVPSVPYYVFMSAGPDFKFYQPYPCGLYNLVGSEADKTVNALANLVGNTLASNLDEHLTPKAKNKNKNKNGATSSRSGRKDPKTSKQVGLPFMNEIEIAKNRAAITPDPGIMPAFETFFDYMKIWSRSVSFFDYDNDDDEEPIPNAEVGMTSPCWFPPVDRARDVDANNSWFFTQDYVAYLSILFLYWRGTIGVKVNVGAPRYATPLFIYTALRGIDDSVYRVQTHSPFFIPVDNLPAPANFATGAVATPSSLQPILEASIPYRGTNIWSTSILNSYGRGVARLDDPQPALVHTNVILEAEGGLLDAMFRKVDSDFSLCLESTLPPPLFWIRRGQPVGA